MYKHIIVGISLFILLGGTAFALPISSSHQNLLPFVDNTYHLGTTSPSNLRWKAIYLGTGTSTSAGGFDLSGGCYAINGVCLVSGAGDAASKWATSTTDNTAIYSALARKVGISTTSPYAALSVVGSTGVVADKYHATNTNAVSSFAGTVGIKTTSPAASLHVSSGLGSTQLLAQFGENGVASEVYFTNGKLISDSGLFRIKATNLVGGDIPLTFEAATEHARFTTAGFLGIASTAPWTLLSVHGTSSGITLTSTGNATNTANWGWNITNGCYAVAETCLISNTSGLTGSGAANRATFWTSATNISSDNAFVWDNTNKRLGIATDTPFTTLSVQGTSTGATLYAYSNTATNTANNGWNINKGCYAMSDTCLISNSSGLTGSGANGRVTFWNSATNITSSSTFFWNNNLGLLGIGTTSPEVLLDAWGDGGFLKFTSRTDINHAIGLRNNAVGNKAWNLYQLASTDITPNGFLIEHIPATGISLRALTISQNGKVGIGTTTVPRTELDINGLLSFVPQTHVIPNDGGIGRPAYTLVATSSAVSLTCNDVSGCDITMSEAGAVDGMFTCITNLAANNSNFADTGGLSELAGAFAMGQYDMLCLDYRSDRWVERSRSNN